MPKFDISLQFTLESRIVTITPKNQTTKYRQIKAVFSQPCIINICSTFPHFSNKTRLLKIPDTQCTRNAKRIYHILYNKNALSAGKVLFPERKIHIVWIFFEAHENFCSHDIRRWFFGFSLASTCYIFRTHKDAVYFMRTEVDSTWNKCILFRIRVKRNFSIGNTIHHIPFSCTHFIQC